MELLTLWKEMAMKIVLDENGNVLGTHKHELNQEKVRKQDFLG